MCIAHSAHTTNVEPTSDKSYTKAGLRFRWGSGHPRLCVLGSVFHTEAEFSKMARVAKCSLFLIKCIALGCNGFFVAASILSLIYNFPLKSVESFVAMLLLALIALAGLVMV